MTGLRVRADLYGKQVLYCRNIAVHLYCYLVGVRCKWIIMLAKYEAPSASKRGLTRLTEKRKQTNEPSLVRETESE